MHVNPKQTTAVLVTRTWCEQVAGSCPISPQVLSPSHAIQLQHAVAYVLLITYVACVRSYRVLILYIKVTVS